MRADRVIAEIAAGQHGLITRAQLQDAGQDAGVLNRRLQSGYLCRLHRGVYQVGPVAMPLARVMAAVLACSGGRGAARAGAVASHHSAAALWQLPPGATLVEPVDVLVPGLARGRYVGVRAHRAGRLCADETTRLEGIPVTTPARTLLDLAAGTALRDLERLVAHAEREGLAGQGVLASLLARHPLHHGAAALRRVLALHGGPQFTRSEAEARLLALFRRGGLPAPALNVRVAGYEVDFLWRAERLVVEVDGFAYHSSAHAFERDRRRDAALTAAGIRVVRFTWRQVADEPESVLVTVARTLWRPGS
jgi:very-short-patch-repair endonuclease